MQSYFSIGHYLGTGKTGAGNKLPVDINVLVPNVQVTGIVGGGREAPIHDVSASIGGRYMMTGLGTIKNRFIIGRSAHRNRKATKAPAVVINHF